MTHVRSTKSLISGFTGPERNGKCVFVCVILEKYYERLIFLYMAKTSPYY